MLCVSTGGYVVCILEHEGHSVPASLQYVCRLIFIMQICYANVVRLNFSIKSTQDTHLQMSDQLYCHFHNMFKNIQRCEILFPLITTISAIGKKKCICFTTIMFIISLSGGQCG